MVMPVSVNSASPSSVNPYAEQRADNVFDSSGWTVATSGSKASGGCTWCNYAAAAGVVLVAMMLWKKR